MILARFRKQPAEERRYYIDYVDRLDEQLLTAVEYIKITPDDTDPILQVSAALNTDANKVLFMVLGGLDLTIYKVEFGVRTDSGELWEDEVEFICEDY